MTSYVENNYVTSIIGNVIMTSGNDEGSPGEERGNLEESDI